MPQAGHEPGATGARGWGEVLRTLFENGAWRNPRGAEPVVISGFAGGAPGLWFSLSFVVLGGLNLLGACSTEAWQTGGDGCGPPGAGRLFFGAVLMAIGGWLLRTRWQIEELVPLPLLCRRMGCTEAEVQRLATARGVRPRYVVDGLEYYHAADLMDAEGLLRASAAPAGAEELLRVALAGPGAEEALLRSCAGEGAISGE
ncbi:MAG: hypothetical protein RMJ43_08025 [Chloroherpetonaceae bacterium]|nr:hypothetical protein [Chthonomonadaceae bacterium]MDW8207769.1 hypothetical protein [Chloroherpetonaceae bacterium]